MVNGVCQAVLLEVHPNHSTLLHTRRLLNGVVLKLLLALSPIFLSSSLAINVVPLLHCTASLVRDQVEDIRSLHAVGQANRELRRLLGRLTLPDLTMVLALLQIHTAALKLCLNLRLRSLDPVDLASPIPTTHPQALGCRLLRALVRVRTADLCHLQGADIVRHQRFAPFRMTAASDRRMLGVCPRRLAALVISTICKGLRSWIRHQQQLWRRQKLRLNANAKSPDPQRALSDLMTTTITNGEPKSQQLRRVAGNWKATTTDANRRVQRLAPLLAAHGETQVKGAVRTNDAPMRTTTRQRLHTIRRRRCQDHHMAQVNRLRGPLHNRHQCRHQPLLHSTRQYLRSTSSQRLPSGCR